MPSTPLSSASCPFCNIAAAYPPIPPSTFQDQNNADKTAALHSDTTPETHAHLVLSAKSVLAFLDIMPLTRGHVLVTTRNHYEKLGDMDVGASREMGQWLPIIARVVMRTLFGADQESDWSWNVVQNNGVRAAQQVPHVHFHIIPRPPSNPVPAAANVGFVVFGRGKRDELDDEEGENLSRALREEMAREVQRLKQKEGIDLDLDSADIQYQRKAMGNL